MKTNNYKLTVCTTTYNQEDYIKDCIEGVVNQKTNFPFQMIIADDGSTDKTKEIIKEYAKKYPDIVKPIFREKNLGPMDNFAATLNEAHTEYVALCDGDDFWTNMDKLQMQVDFLDSHKDYSICFHQTKIYFEDNSEPPVFYPTEMKTDFGYDEYMKGNMLVANAVVYRWLFKEEDSFKKIFPKDITPGDFYVHLLHAKAGKTHYINKPMSIYRRQPNGMWYGTSKPEFKVELNNKYGLKLINFYEEIERELNIDDENFDAIRDWVIKDVIDAAFRKPNEELLKALIDRYYENQRYHFTEYLFDLNKRDRKRFSKVLNKYVK